MSKEIRLVKSTIEVYCQRWKLEYLNFAMLWVSSKYYLRLLVYKLLRCNNRKSHLESLIQVQLIYWKSTIVTALNKKKFPWGFIAQYMDAFLRTMSFSVFVCRTSRAEGLITQSWLAPFLLISSQT